MTLKWKGEEFSPNKNIPDFLEKKADQAFQGEMAVPTRLSEAQTVALLNLACSSNLKRMELIQANQSFD